MDRKEALSLFDLRQTVYLRIEKDRNKVKTELSCMWQIDACIQKGRGNGTASMLRLPGLQNV
jgi:hypothetical protein